MKIEFQQTKEDANSQSLLTLMKYIKQPRGQTVQVKSDHEDGPII